MEFGMWSEVEAFVCRGFPGWRGQMLVRTTEMFGKEIRDGIDDLPHLFEFIDTELPWAVKLHRVSLEAEVFSSASYPECPGVVFWTDLIRYHIAPHVTLLDRADLRSYAVIENLVHESIHQWWGKKIVENNLESLIANLPDIQVNWRKASWCGDKALHAGLVYLGLAELRCRLCPEFAPAAREAAYEIIVNLLNEKEFAGLNLVSLLQSSLKDPSKGAFLLHIGAL